MSYVMYLEFNLKNYLNGSQILFINTLILNINTTKGIL